MGNATGSSRDRSASDPTGSGAAPHETNETAPSRRRRSSLLGRRREQKSVDLPATGRELFTGSFECTEGTSPKPTFPYNNDSLAKIGMQMVHEGIYAMNKNRILAFVEETSPTCADCIDGDSPRWCAMAFGVFVCDLCAGALRSLPASVTGGVRSLYIDTWSDDHVADIIKKGGNVVLNEILEYHVPDNIKKPRKNVTKSSDRRRWMQLKYEHQDFRKRDDLPPKRAISDTPMSQPQRIESFGGGRQLMVGVVDLSVTEVQNMPKSVINSQYLFGGFVLHFILGRFKMKTLSSFSGRKWIGRQIHLSWDGVSPLEVHLMTGNNRLIGSTAVPLADILSGPDHYQQAINITIVPEKSTSFGFVSGSLESIQISIRLNFMDLRT